MPLNSERTAVLQAIFGCAETVATRLGQLAVWTSAHARQILLRQGDQHQRCHIVISGSADIRVVGHEGQCIQIATVEPGEIFGSYPGSAEVRAEVQAQKAMELVSLEAGQLARLALECSEVGAGLARIFAGQLANVLDRFASRVTLTATGRVYAQLLELIDERGAIGKAPSVTMLAIRAQTTRETASRAVSALERRGILRREADAWIIVSPRMLEDLVI